MRVIVAIGGGEIRRRSTLTIDREIIRLSGKKYPKFLFIPTASSDSQSYWKHVQQYFGKLLRCRTDVLWLLREESTLQEIRKKILGADIIYVGGGNTLMMMRRWRRLGVDCVLKAAYNKGIVLSGISAGAICWFGSGHSDSMSFTHPKKWKYIRVRGMGLVHGILCPHFNSRTLGKFRRREFQKMIDRIGGKGLALTDNCAFVIIDGKPAKIIRTEPYAGAYVVRKGDRPRALWLPD